LIIFEKQFVSQYCQNNGERFNERAKRRSQKLYYYARVHNVINFFEEKFKKITIIERGLILIKYTNDTKHRSFKYLRKDNI